jgi:hypothetical protein
MCLSVYLYMCVRSDIDTSQVVGEGVTMVIGPKDLELWEELVNKALSFISLIIKPEQAPGFLMQLVSGRFNGF